MDKISGPGFAKQLYNQAAVIQIISAVSSIKKRISFPIHRVIDQ
jgi:hypothetical protein